MEVQPLLVSFTTEQNIVKASVFVENNCATRAISETSENTCEINP